MTGPIVLVEQSEYSHVLSGDENRVLYEPWDWLRSCTEACEAHRQHIMLTLLPACLRLQEQQLKISKSDELVAEQRLAT